MENDGTWHAETAERIGRAVFEQRKKLGMTAQQLSERCAELGAPIHRTTITKIENGRPRFDLGELIVLAAALNTSPVSLLYPKPSDEVSDLVEVLPGVEATGFQAAQWVSGHRPGFTNRVTGSGEAPGAGGRETARNRAEWEASTRELQLWRRIDELRRLERSDSFVPIRGQLTEAQRLLMETYDREIRELKRELGLSEDA